MKSLQTVQKTFRVFQILTQIAMILCFVWAGLAALGMLCGAVWYHGGVVVGASQELLYRLTETGGLAEMTGVLLTETIFALTDGILLAFAYRYLKAEQADGTPFTREGAHSDKRILFHEDITGEEITSKLLAAVKKLPNVTILENTKMVDIVAENNCCYGVVIRREDGSIDTVQADYTVWACGGIGGLYRHSTNFRHLTGDALALSIRHDIRLKDVNYVQIHPTTFYSEDEEERSFLISESVRGEGAKLYDKHMNRFVNELLPRDLLTEEIYKQMEKDGTDFVWEDLRPIPEKELKEHFPNIVEHCRQMGYDVTKECIPVVPAQHYFMGGVWVDHESHTSMERLYAVGETACNGVHGKNRLASNSLLESLVFARRAALQMSAHAGEKQKQKEDLFEKINLEDYTKAQKLASCYHSYVRNAIIEADEKSTQESDEGHRVKSAFRKSGSKSAY